MSALGSLRSSDVFDQALRASMPPQSRLGGQSGLALARLLLTQHLFATAARDSQQCSGFSRLRPFTTALKVRSQIDPTLNTRRTNKSRKFPPFARAPISGEGPIRSGSTKITASQQICRFLSLRRAEFSGNQIALSLRLRFAIKAR